MFDKTQRKLTLFYASVMSLLVIILIVGAYESMKWSIKNEQVDAVRAFSEEEAIEHSLFLQKEPHEFPREVESNTLVQAENKKRQMFVYALNLENQLIHSTDLEKVSRFEIIDQVAHWNDRDEEVKEFVSLEGRRILMASQEIYVDGKVVGIVYVGRDVTSVLEGVEESLWGLIGLGFLALLFAIIGGHKMAQKAIVPLEDSYQKQKQFASDASHELRTPLAVLKTSVASLKRNSQKNPAAMSQILTDMDEEIDQMSHLLEKLLLLARSTQNQVDLGVEEEVNLNQLIQSIILKMNPLIQEKKLIVRYEGELKDSIKGNPPILSQLVVIFLENAIKHSFEFGEIKLTVVQEKNKGITLRIQDFGEGIPEEDQTHIFNRFYRVEKSRNIDLGGTGLGLSIAKEIVDRYQGRIEVQSQLGKGSLFTIYLPL